MRKPILFLVLFLPMIAACTTEPAIKKTNCWSSMALVPTADCEFEYVPAVH